VYCHPGTTQELRTGKINGFFSKHAGSKVAPPKGFDMFVELRDNQTLDIGGFRARALFAPGHSEASVVYLINDNLFTGDVLFANTIGRTDLMPNGSALMQETLAKLLKVNFETAYHGHDKSSSYAEQQRNMKDSKLALSF